MERKTAIALVVILCIILAVVILVVVYFDGGGLIGEENHAKDYILSELGGEILDCSIDEDGVHTCYLIYKEDERKVGEIWIYYYPGGIEPYKAYTIQGGADQMIRSDDVTILLKGSQQFREEACSLYNEKFGFRCTAFERP
jgi:hypothetical protein